MTFERAFSLTSQAEGGYSNHPADKGGSTYRGVTQKTFSLWMEANKEEDRPVLTMTDAEYKTLLFVNYWKRAHCDELPERTGCYHFDAAVNHGPANAVRLLQAALGVELDGAWGPQTAAAAKCDDATTLSKYNDARRDFYARIVVSNPSQAVFIDGWYNRLRALMKALQ